MCSGLYVCDTRVYVRVPITRCALSSVSSVDKPISLIVSSHFKNLLLTYFHKITLEHGHTLCHTFSHLPTRS
jgi:hypothetical protein